MHCSHLGCCGDCRESMAAARHGKASIKRWRRRSLFVRLGSESQGRDPLSASLGAADLARKAGAMPKRSARRGDCRAAGSDLEWQRAACQNPQDGM